MPSRGAQDHGVVSKKAALGLSSGHGWKPIRAKSNDEKDPIRGKAVLMDILGHSRGGSPSIMPCLAYSALPSTLSIPPERQGL